MRPALCPACRTPLAASELRAHASCALLLCVQAIVCGLVLCILTMLIEVTLFVIGSSRVDAKVAQREARAVGSGASADRTKLGGELRQPAACARRRRCAQGGDTGRSLRGGLQDKHRMIGLHHIIKKE